MKLLEKIGHIKNPLTVISIFAGVAEISGTTVLPFMQPNNQDVYIWFLMLFPVGLVIIFFITLNFNHKVLYAPSDYKDEDNFVKLFGIATIKEEESKLKEEVEEVESGSSNENEGLNSNLESQSSEEKSNNFEKMNNNGFNFEQKYSIYFNKVNLSEKLAILKLSRDMNIDFKRNLVFKTLNNRRILFDGIAFQKNKIHAVEVKFFQDSSIQRSRLEKVLLQYELLMSEMKENESKEVILHFFAVIDNSNVEINDFKSRLDTYFLKYKNKVVTHVVTLSDLMKEYEYRI
ncbi:hypothetical protein [Acinetobacter nosocomialis]|uniref:hypothetical protein n=1 Tax=Acinetobacter nosocomialis TaxID=106654 RepID=UPI00124D1E8F|nr:hypothetical protein [Acinetobacter nosocomialis]